MTENQLKYLAHQETARHNVAMEGQAADELTERSRANRVGEAQRDRQLGQEDRSLDQKDRSLDQEDRSLDQKDRDLTRREVETAWDIGKDTSDTVMKALGIAFPL